MSSRPILRRTGVAVGALSLGACGSREPSALSPGGSAAQQISVLWWVMFALGSAVFVLVVSLLVRARRGRTPTDAPETADGDRSGHRWILWGGVVLPVVVVVPVSLLTLVIGDRLSQPPDDDAVRIELVGHQFWWEVRYPGTGAVTANEIHLPVGRDAHITMTSEDVIHSFWVPSLHGKVDLIPGEDTEIVLDAEEPGVYEALCAEYCGIQHAHMRLLVVADEPHEFDAWLDEVASDAAPPRTEDEREGARVFGDAGCASCHTVRGTDARGDVGPDLTHLASRLTLGANTVPNTRGHLGGWVANAQQAKPGNLMPPSVLSGPELNALIAYLEALE